MCQYIINVYITYLNYYILRAECADVHVFFFTVLSSSCILYKLLMLETNCNLDKRPIYIVRNAKRYFQFAIGFFLQMKKKGCDNESAIAAQCPCITVENLEKDVALWLEREVRPLREGASVIGARRTASRTDKTGARTPRPLHALIIDSHS